MSDGTTPDKASLIVMSGDMDKVMGAFIIANGAAAFDMKVTMFFTFWGLKAIQKGNLTGKSVMGKMLGVHEPRRRRRASAPRGSTWGAWGAGCSRR